MSLLTGAEDGGERPSNYEKTTVEDHSVESNISIIVKIMLNNIVSATKGKIERLKKYNKKINNLMRVSKIQKMENLLRIMENQLSNSVIEFYKNGDLKAAVDEQVKRIFVTELLDKCLKIKNKEI